MGVSAVHKLIQLDAIVLIGDEYVWGAYKWQQIIGYITFPLRALEHGTDGVILLVRAVYALLVDHLIVEYAIIHGTLSDLPVRRLSASEALLVVALQRRV